jgi:uncharacterized protein involved in outer membrane biogenesis
MLELAGLNLANAVFVKIFGDKQVHLNCLASDFAVTNGQADVRRFVLDTDTAVVNVTGNVNLANETLDLDVRPAPRARASSPCARRCTRKARSRTRTWVRRKARWP